MSYLAANKCALNNHINFYNKWYQVKAVFVCRYMCVCIHVCWQVSCQGKRLWGKFGENALVSSWSFVFFFFSHPGITNKISSVLYTVLCTVMPLLPPWLLLKHLTTVIVLYINCTPWWLPYYLFFFPKWWLQILAAWLLVLLTISTLCQGWFGKWGGGVGNGDLEFLWCFGFPSSSNASRRFGFNLSCTLTIHGMETLGLQRTISIQLPSGPTLGKSDLWNTGVEMMD